eukprot:TRINITY_DN10315_c0_g1_i3.p1 TRINITY_DN10315_c0_g1~~TRINITY_DN10315_c0_g1_i3.p1  ORF type:complete len:566 (+),score=70.48 TRINITY_DN10315_c0_g1_i3:20-1717(+)
MSLRPENSPSSLGTENANAFEKIKFIGRGSRGSCFLVRRKDDGQLLVIKEVRPHANTSRARAESSGSLSSPEAWRGKLVAAESNEIAAEDEVSVMKCLDQHPNIINYHSSFTTPSGKLKIVLDYADGGDLHQLIQRYTEYGQFIDEEQIVRWSLQIALAIQHSHKRKIIHRDLKPKNIFLTQTSPDSDELSIKIGDFGIAKALNSSSDFAKTFVGTSYYLSPEMCEDKPYDLKSDIWQFGCVIYELATLKHAFDGKSLPAIVMKILAGIYVPLPTHYSKELQHLVSRMLQILPQDRPSIDEIVRILQSMANREMVQFPALKRKQRKKWDRSPVNLFNNRPKAYSLDTISRRENDAKPTSKLRKDTPTKELSPAKEPDSFKLPRLDFSAVKRSSPRTPINGEIHSARSSTRSTPASTSRIHSHTMKEGMLSGFSSARRYSSPSNATPRPASSRYADNRGDRRSLGDTEGRRPSVKERGDTFLASLKMDPEWQEKNERIRNHRNALQEAKEKHKQDIHVNAMERFSNILDRQHNRKNVAEVQTLVDSLSSKFFSSFPHGTCLLSDFH